MFVNRSRTFKSLATITLCVAAAALGACSKSGEATGATCPTDSTLTYANFGQQFITTNCSSCHTSRESPTLITQAQVQANRDEIDMVAAAGPNAVNTVMPDGASVSTADRTLLGQWLACGAP